MLTLLRIVISLSLLGLPVILLLVSILKSNSTSDREKIAVIFTSILLGFVALYWSSFLASRLPEYPTGSILRSVVLQMDVQRVVDTLTKYWEGEGTRTTVHPLMPLLFQPIAFLVSRFALCASELRAAQLTAGILLMLSAILLFVTTYYYGRRWFLAFVLVLGYILSFGYMILSIFPESSGLASYTVILPYAIYAVHREKPLSRNEVILHFLAGLLTLGVTTTNFLHALIVYAVRMWYCTSHKIFATLRRLTFYVGSVTFGAAVLSILQRKVLYLGAEYWFFPSSVSAETSALSRLNLVV